MKSILAKYRPASGAPASAAAGSPAPRRVTDPSHEAVAKRAYEIWVGKSHPAGQDEQNWREAYVYFMHEDTGTGPKFADRFLKLAEA